MKTDSHMPPHQQTTTATTEPEPGEMRLLTETGEANGILNLPTMKSMSKIDYGHTLAHSVANDIFTGKKCEDL